MKRTCGSRDEAEQSDPSEDVGEGGSAFTWNTGHTHTQMNQRRTYAYLLLFNRLENLHISTGNGCVMVISFFITGVSPSEENRHRDIETKTGVIWCQSGSR